jgi:nicotinamide-nucleotide amidase
VTEPQDEAPSSAVGLLAGHLERTGGTLATAESLTGGLLANQFARATGSSNWFRGGIVAYASEVKYHVLDVPVGPVVTEEAARTMAEQVAELLEADVGIAVTGVGGPDPQDGQPPGTVWMAVHDETGTRSVCHHFEGSPEEVCERTCAAAVELTLGHVRSERTPA